VLQKLNESSSDWLLLEKAELWANNDFREKTREALHISENTVNNLNLGLIRDKDSRLFLGYPVMYNGIVMDIRQYNVLKHKGVPKIMAKEGARNGWVIPYDLWNTSDKMTYVFEGEKDMILGRELGLNAITLTGGANAKPNEFVINSFKEKDVVICYDNDEAGRNGAKHLYRELQGYAKSIKYIDISEGVKQEKEDFYDYIVKYNNEIFDFFMLDTHDFSVEDDIKVELTKIKEALKSNIIRKRLTSHITVSAEFADAYAVPSVVTFEKVGEFDKAGNSTLMVGEEKFWYLDKNNAVQLLELIETAADKNAIAAKIRSFVGIPAKERDIKMKTSDYKTIYKARVSDKVEETGGIQLDLYTFNKLVVGKQSDPGRCLSGDHNNWVRYINCKFCLV